MMKVHQWLWKNSNAFFCLCLCNWKRWSVYGAWLRGIFVCVVLTTPSPKAFKFEVEAKDEGFSLLSIQNSDTEETELDR